MPVREAEVAGEELGRQVEENREAPTQQAETAERLGRWSLPPGGSDLLDHQDTTGLISPQFALGEDLFKQPLPPVAPELVKKHGLAPNALGFEVEDFTTENTPQPEEPEKENAPPRPDSSAPLQESAAQVTEALNNIREAPPERVVDPRIDPAERLRQVEGRLAEEIARRNAARLEIPVVGQRSPVRPEDPPGVESQSTQSPEDHTQTKDVDNAEQVLERIERELAELRE